MSATSDFFRQIADALDAMEERPYGPEVDGEEDTNAKHACVQLAGGEVDQGRALWKTIEHDCGEYVPRAAALALIRAASATMLMPDVVAPELT